MDWKEAKHIEENKYDLPGDWLKLEYFEALNILFRIENTLRIFVYIILKEIFQEKWLKLSIMSDDSEDSTIAAIAKKRLAQDKNYAYLGYELPSLLFHITSGELIRLITSDSYWKYFKKYFLGSREIIRNKLDEIGNVRNSLAHFRPIKKGDIELVKQNANHSLLKIEEILYDFITCPDIVPTNTTEDWYIELNSLKIPELKCSFKQSKGGYWINIVLSFISPKLSIDGNNYSYYIRALNLKTDNLLRFYPELTKFIISCTETTPHKYLSNPESDDLIKDIQMKFSRETLINNYEQIKDVINNILNEISQEIGLIKEDNLARGRLIEVVNLYMFSNTKKMFRFEETQFKTVLTELTPVEFWGSIGLVSRDFITNTDRYPWMPVDISEDKDNVPF